MAPTNTKTKKVTVDTTKLRALAKQFEKWSTDLNTLLLKAGRIKITPGSTQNAVDLATRFGAQIKNLGDNLKALVTSFSEISRTLGKIAEVYDRTEDINKDDLYRLDELMETVGKHLPGIEKVIPPELNYEPPTSPKPE